MIGGFALIFGTWAVALAIARPIADRTEGFFLPLLLINGLGCSGSIVAVCIS